MSKGQVYYLNMGLLKRLNIAMLLLTYLLETMFMKREYTSVIYAMNPLNLHKDCMRMFTGLILLLSVLINRNLL